MQFQLSCELFHGEGKAIVPNVLSQPPQEQHGGGQEAEEGETEASRALRKQDQLSQSVSKSSCSGRSQLPPETAEERLALQSAHNPFCLAVKLQQTTGTTAGGSKLNSPQLI